MRHCRWFALFGCLFLLAAPARAADSKTTRQLLTKYTEDLTNLWKEYASDKHKDTRDRAIQDYQQTFQREVANAEVPAGLKVNAITQTFIENMANSATLFRLEKMNTTRTAYLQGCVQAFKREYAKASDYAEPRTTQKVFELTMLWLENARDGLRRASNDAQQQTYSAINEMSGAMLQAATVPEGDALAQMDKNIQDARRKFPINSEVLKQMNQQLLQILEQRAKDAQQKAKK